MDAYGNYKGTPGYAGVGEPGRATTMTPKAQMDMFGYVKYPTNPPVPTKPAPAPAPAPARPAAPAPAPGIGTTNISRYGAMGPGGTIGYGSNLGSLGSMNPGVGYSGYAGYAGSGYGGYPSSTSFGMGLGGGGLSSPSQGGIQGSPSGPSKQGPTGNVRGG